jgi:integrase/recombinase XerD
MAAYQVALGDAENENRRTKYRRPSPGSFGAVCLAYYASPTFKKLDGSTQNWRRRSLDEICRNHGDKPLARMESKHIRRLRNEKTRGAARNRLKALRALFRWAVEEELAPHDPTLGVQFLEYARKVGLLKKLKLLKNATQ